jgi:aminomethyltransferase
MSESVAELKRTPLHARHRASNARMVPYAGWEMPVEYAGISSEHIAVRTRAGVFDVSHMGQIEVAGKNAVPAVQRILCNDASRLAVGQAQYSALLTEQGTFLDDVVVYRMAPVHFMLVVNAANVAKDVAWVTQQAALIGDVAVVDSSSRYSLLALQGPAAQAVLQPLTGVELEGLKRYWFGYGEVASARVTIARTGYTGEDGFEIFVPPAMADRVWQAILESGRSAGILPCGLGARDTLRLEAAMRLYGNDIDESTTPLEAGLDWIVGWQKTDFIGREGLASQRTRGVPRRLVGLEMLDRGIARQGCPVEVAGTPVGVVTSGTQTPFLKKAIALAYVPPEAAMVSSRVEVDVRGKRVRAAVVPLPFYKRSS